MIRSTFNTLSLLVIHFNGEEPGISLVDNLDISDFRF